MVNKLMQVFNLKCIKYPWLLLLSMAAFTAALYFNRLYPDVYAKTEIVIYGAAFILALLWSSLNYVGHLRLSPIYKTHNNIDSFISRLAMNTDDEADLRQYLNDFVRDLEEKGNAHDEAVKTAISHFQVREFTEARGIKFETPTHFYLLGYAIVFAGIIIAIQCLNSVVSLHFVILAACFVLILYSTAFVCLFFIYKVMDALIAKK